MSAELLLALSIGLALGAGAGWLLRDRRRSGGGDASATDIRSEVEALASDLACLKTLREADAADQKAGRDAEADALDRLEETVRNAQSRLKSLEQSLRSEGDPKQER